MKELRKDVRLEDFDYFLPEELIANDAAEPRDCSRLLVYDSKRDLILHKRFSDLPEFLGEKDVLVMNRSKVVKARILLAREKIKEKEKRKSFF